MNKREYMKKQNSIEITHQTQYYQRQPTLSYARAPQGSRNTHTQPHIPNGPHTHHESHKCSKYKALLQSSRHQAKNPPKFPV